MKNTFQNLYCFVFIYFVLILPLLTSAVIQHEDVKNDKNVVVFTILNGETIEVPNHHKNFTPKLKFSLRSTQIEKVDKLLNNNSSVWALHLADHSSLDVTVQEISGQSNAADSTTEYSILWHGDHHKAGRELCLHYPKNASSGTFWYQGYVSNNSHWPMDPMAHMEKVQFNYMLELERYSVPTAANRWTREFQFILEHLLLSSDGFAVHLDHRQPLFIRRDPNGHQSDSLICFSTAIDNRYYSSRLLKAPGDLDLKLKLFSARNTRVVTDYLVHRSGLIRKPTALPRDLSLIHNPTFTSDAIFGLVSQSPPNYSVFNEANIAHYIENITSGKTTAISPNSEFIIERYSWLNYSLPAYEVDSIILPNMTSFAAKLTAKKGVRLGGMLAAPELKIFNGKSNPEYSKMKHHLLHTPTGYTNWLLDLTRAETAKLYSTLLSKLHRQYGISTFWLKSFILWGDFDFADSVASRYSSLLVPAYIAAAYQAAEAASNLSNHSQAVSVVTEVAYRSQHLPVFTRLTHYYPTSAAQLLRELVPSMLAASIAGYSFLLPFPIGTFNDYLSEANNDRRHHFKKPSEELYIRLLQATTFMACQTFTRPPWNYSAHAVDLTRKFLRLHAEHAETIVALANRRITEGSPVIRPLWYQFPDQPRAYTIGDQYLMGENILVAPVVVEGGRQRQVFIPPGQWLDQHGKVYQGPKEVTVAAPLEELPYFKRVEHFD